MDNIDDPEKILAALEQLEAEKEKRLAAKAKSGEVIVVTDAPISVRGETTEEVIAEIEAYNARRIEQLRNAGEKREIMLDVLAIKTGVPRADDDDPPPPHSSSSDNSYSWGGRHAESPSPRFQAAGEGFIAPAQSARYIRIQVRPGSDETGDPGEIAEGFYSVEDGAVVLRDYEDRHLASQTLRDGEDAAEIARQLLRETLQGRILIAGSTIRRRALRKRQSF